MIALYFDRDDTNFTHEQQDEEGTLLFDKILEALEEQSKGKAFPSNSALLEAEEKFKV